jgi:hypothetical protein
MILEISLIGLLLHPEDGPDMFLRNIEFLRNTLLYNIKTVLFKQNTSIILHYFGEDQLGDLGVA